MKKISLSMLLMLFYISLGLAQNNLNAYKYVIVPKKYDFLKEEDKYQLNSLTEFLFKKKGFITVSEGENYPAELIENPCLGVTTNIIDNSRLFTTKLKIELIDCYNKAVFTSVEGKSNEKEYQKTYQEAFRNAFMSVETLNYQFEPDLVVNLKTNVEVPQTTITPQVVQTVEKDLVEIKEESSKNISGDRVFKNKDLSFILIEVENGFTAYVNQSEDANYTKGEKIGDLTKTSLANVFRVTWKDVTGNFKQTSGHFDESGNLYIDVNRNGNIEALVFKEVK